MLVSSFKSFKVITKEDNGRFITVKQGRTYEVILNVYRTETHATKGHEEITSFYKKVISDNKPTTIGESAKFMYVNGK